MTLQLRQRSSEPSVNGGPYQSAMQLAAVNGYVRLRPGFVLSWAPSRGVRPSALLSAVASIGRDREGRQCRRLHESADSYRASRPPASHGTSRPLTHGYFHQSAGTLKPVDPATNLRPVPSALITANVLGGC